MKLGLDYTVASRQGLINFCNIDVKKVYLIPHLSRHCTACTSIVYHTRHTKRCWI